MPTEEQLLYDIDWPMYDVLAVGQKLTISNRVVSKLAFWIKRIGNPVGTLNYRIQTDPGNVILLIKYFGDVAGLPTDWVFLELPFDDPLLINQAVKMYCDASTGGASQNASNCTHTRYKNSDVKADENLLRATTSYPTKDYAYRYTYLSAPTGTTDPATGIGTAAATPNGTLDDDGGEACDCGFEWGETIAYGNTTPTQSRTTGQTFAQTISGLDPGKTYHFRAFATNSVGTSHGADRTFTTETAVPTATTDEAAGLAAVLATLNGTLDSDGGEACECGFEWGLDTDYGTITSTETKTAVDTFSQVIGGLVPNTTYHFRAFATNSAGTGHGADRSFTTALVISRGHPLAREEL